ncbi:alpha/beta hydrolase [Romeria aff. gracilis LEGE 07310]|uniref:Monoacylglycerol lipase n=1 Tax=Vasconcelosia minhoensis LEGE 07310 TaxID=915328 RepID=A0A8J7A414_9CYAN|nr:alpha/beta hydrolase [Romeria gracilis]MBE9075737.1 alpha/beta hydrolase [Romeria aff. gracilis LEGE 07310]
MTSTQLTQTEGTFTGANGLSLYYQAWCPARTPLGILALVHGLGEHSSRYAAIAADFTQAGYAVCAFDNQGHGQSEGQRGHIDSWQDYQENLRAFLQLVRQRQPQAPLFLMGHSLGGLIVLDYVLRYPDAPEVSQLRGLVVSAPPIRPVGVAKPYRVAIARLLSGIFPRFSLKVGIDTSGLTRDPEVNREAAADPLVHPYATLRWGSETLKTIAWVKRHIAELGLPMLLIHGEADPIICPQGSREIFQQIQLSDKCLRLYPGAYHEPHNDLDAQQVIHDLLAWLDQHLDNA